MNERTFHPSQAHKLDDPERLQWLPPDEILGHLNIREGSTIADVGAGTGYFSFPFAEAVGNAGKVYAVDFQREMLQIIRHKLRQPGSPSNISIVEGDAVQTGLSGASCDIVFMANIWHELDGHPEVLRECSKILRPGGMLAILDWSPDMPSPPGPPVEHRISPDEVRQALERSDWTISRAIAVGKFSYLVLAMHSATSVRKAR